MTSKPGRRVRRAFFSGCLGLFCFLFPNLAEAGKVTILTPADQALVNARRPVRHLVLKLADPTDEKNITVKNQKDHAPITPTGSWEHAGHGYMHFALPLKPGKNVFVIAPAGKQLRLDYRPLRTMLNANLDKPGLHLFHRNTVTPPECRHCHTTQLPRDAQVQPAPVGRMDSECYSCHTDLIVKPIWKHGPAAMVLCRSCHQQGKDRDRISIFTGRIDSLCFRCHINQKNWLDMPHVHGPVGTGDCTVCHDPHGDNFRGQVWADGKSDLCLGCHIDKKQLFTNKEIKIHGIIQGLGCTSCHSPHATQYRFQLFKPINQLCTGCHTKLAGVAKGHPVGGHPTSGPKDPRRADRKFGCTSCHNPHGSKYNYLLIGSMIGGNVCNKCHH